MSHSSSDSPYPDSLASVAQNGFVGAAALEDSYEFIVTDDIPFNLEKHDDSGVIFQEMIYRYNQHDRLQQAERVLRKIVGEDELYGHIPPVLRKEAEDVLE